MVWSSDAACMSGEPMYRSCGTRVAPSSVMSLE